MIKRTLYQFGLTALNEEGRAEIGNLAFALEGLLPDARVSWESVKTDLCVLRIEVEEDRA